VDTVRVDSGGTLNAALLRAGVVDEVSLMIHPALTDGLVRTVFRGSRCVGDEAALGGQLLGRRRWAMACSAGRSAREPSKDAVAACRRRGNARQPARPVSAVPNAARSRAAGRD
jgi:hypothetical protein